MTYFFTRRRHLQVLLGVTAARKQCLAHQPRSQGLRRFQDGGQHSVEVQVNGQPLCG